MSRTQSVRGGESRVERMALDKQGRLEKTGCQNTYTYGMYYAGKRVQRNDLDREVKKERMVSQGDKKRGTVLNRETRTWEWFYTEQRDGDQSGGVVLYRETRTKGWF
jgi:hypothetical protein